MSEAATHVSSGKVREIYALDDERLLLVASDRISTFDVVLPTEIPDKGRVLTGLSGFWSAGTWRAPGGRTTSRPARSAATSCHRGSPSLPDCPSRSSRRRRRRRPATT